MFENTGVLAKIVKVDLGTSELYSESDLNDAAEAIKKQFLEFEGCTLHSLTYAGDERSNKEAEYHISHDIIYDEYAVFDSSFHSPKNQEAHGLQIQNIPGPGYLAATIKAYGKLLIMDIADNQ